MVLRQKRLSDADAMQDIFNTVNQRILRGSLFYMSQIWDSTQKCFNKVNRLTEETQIKDKVSPPDGQKGKKL